MLRTVLMFVTLAGLCAAQLGAPLRLAAQSSEVPSGLSSDEEARMRFELGRRFYDTGRFAEAAEEFTEAYRLSHYAELLFNLYLAYRDMGDDVRATETLRDYVATLPDGERRVQLTARLAVMEERVAHASSGTAATDAEGPREDSESAAYALASPSEASGAAGEGGLGAAPWVVMGIGAAALVGSLLTGLVALDARSTLDASCTADGACPTGFEDTRSMGQSLAITTDVLWVAGGLAVGTGVVLAILDATGHPHETSHADPEVVVACGMNGCVGLMTGSF